MSSSWRLPTRMLSRAAPSGDALPCRGRVEELVSSERTLVVVRWALVVLAVAQVQFHTVDAAAQYPSGVRAAGLAIAGALALGNLAAVVALRRVATVRGASWLAFAAMVLDTLAASGYVWLYTFDGPGVHFLLFFVLPAEAALKFRLAGALGMWAAIGVIYTLRQWWASVVYGFEFSVPSLTYRLGILLVVTILLGLSARQLGRRTDELADALDRLEREESWRSALIDMLAHDFRSPVGSATSALLVVERRLGTLTDDELRRLLGVAIRQNQRGLSLAEDVLALARAKQGRLELRRRDVELAPLLHDVARDLGEDQTWLTIVVAPDLRAIVDGDRLEQVVANLLSNARKHGRPPVTLTARALGEAGVEVSVSDSGEGVPEDYQDDLFAQFARGPRSDSVGLGLWLVDVVATAHGGTATYTTADGLPTFVVTLPGPGQVH